MKKITRQAYMFMSGIAAVVSIAVLGFLYLQISFDTVVAIPDTGMSKLKKILVQDMLPVFAADEKKFNKNASIASVDLNAALAVVSLIEGTTTTVWSYNGTVPGPEIRVSLGDTLRIRLTNNLPQDTTIHFHGIRVPNKMDGVPGVTQRPIAPGDTFVYEFTPPDAGTYWYHPHVRGAEQVERGLYGTIVVTNEEDMSFGQDKVMVLDDWRLTEDAEVYPEFVTGHDISHDGRWGNLVTVNGTKNEVVTASSGETVLLRFVNTANARIFSLDFGALETQAIAFDGIASRHAFDPESVEISPGNRMDVLVKVPDDANVGTTYIVRDTLIRQSIDLFTVEVSGEKNKATSTDVYAPLFNSVLPDWDEAVALEPDVTYRLNAERGGPYGIRWTINGSAFPEGETVSLKKGTFNKLRFINESSRLHPMHLHGQFFKVLARDGVPVDEPFMRDTVLLFGRETVDIGMMPLDTGVWANHCHILEHAEAGMMTVFEVT